MIAPEAAGVWELELDEGWVAFNATTARQIVEARASGINIIDYSARRGEVDFDYTIDFHTMKQINKQTAARRNIRCAVRGFAWRQEQVL